MGLRCINCGILKGRKVLAMDMEDNARQFLHEWISPTVLSEEHEICMQCERLVTSSKSGAPRQFGHHNVCVACGMSVLRRARTYRLKSLRQEYREALEICAGEYLGPHLDNVCFTCYVRTRRALARTASEQVKEEESEPGNEIKPSCKKVNPPNKIIVSSITLPNYKRIEAAACCMFPRCGRDSARVPLTLRQQLLTEHALYVPTSARICRLHLDCHEPSELTSHTLNTFTSDQICDLLFLKKEYLPIDFSDIENMDRHIRKIWLGVSWEEFKEILEQTPGLSKVDDPKLALAIHLTKQRTGENDEVLASLFQMSREELEKNYSWQGSA